MVRGWRRRKEEVMGVGVGVGDTRILERESRVE